MSISLYEKERQVKERISKKFMVALNYYFEDYFPQNPEEASWLGINYHDKKTKDYSDAAYEKEIEFNRETKKRLRMINPYYLTLEEHADLILLKSRLEKALFWHENLPQERKNNPLVYIPIKGIQCMLFRTMKPDERLASITARLKAAPILVEQAKQNLINPPEIWTETAISQLKSVKKFFEQLPDAGIIKESAKDFPESGNKLVEANKICLAALEEYEKYLSVELIEKSHGEYCIGRQAFDFLLTNNHFLEHTSGYLNELGYELMKKAQSDMEALSVRIDKNKSLEQLFEEIESIIPAPDKLLDTYKSLSESTLNFVKDNDIVSFVEDEELQIVETPEYFRDIMPFAAYFCLGPYDKKNVGQFWVTPVIETDENIVQELLKNGHCINKLPAIILHEGYPGHHHQLMYSKQNLFKDKVSSMRRATFNTMFIEGWALYCEQMMAEKGFFNEQQELLMLKQRLWRAARVVIDVELHTGRMSFEEAVGFMVSKLNMSDKFARAEVTRYTMSPTQPLSYEIGRRLINQIRDKEKSKLGSNFSLKQFHDKLLSKGAIPLKLIDELEFSQKVEVLN